MAKFFETVLHVGIVAVVIAFDENGADVRLVPKSLTTFCTS